MLEIVLPVSEIALQRIRDCAAGGGASPRTSIGINSRDSKNTRTPETEAGG